MLFRVDKTFLALQCRVTFCTQGRIVSLHFDSEDGRAWINVPEHVMADITGQFIRERLFGLH